MNLNNASLVVFQNKLAKEVWLNNVLVWSTALSGTVWTLATPPAGGTITGFSVSTTLGTITINWGDNTSNTINSSALVNKTY